MWCRKVRRQLSAYADGELSLVETRSVEEHLSCCEACSREHASLQQLVRITASIPAEEVPNGLHAAILARVAYAETSRPQPRARRPSMGLFSFNPWMWTAVSGATAALLVGLVQKPQRETPAPAKPGASGKVRVAHRRAPEGRRAERFMSARPLPPARAGSHDEPAGQPACPEAALEAGSKAAVPAPTVARAPRKVQVARRPAPAAQPAPPASEPQHTPDRITADPSEVEMREPTAPVTPGIMAVMPGEPMINSVNTAPAPDSLTLGMEKEPSTRMAGSPVEPEVTGEDEEGLRSLQMFLEDRNRTVPQPPLVNPLGSRPLRKL